MIALEGVAAPDDSADSMRGKGHDQQNQRNDTARGVESIRHRMSDLKALASFSIRRDHVFPHFSYSGILSSNGPLSRQGQYVLFVSTSLRLTVEGS